MVLAVAVSGCAFSTMFPTDEVPDFQVRAIDAENWQLKTENLVFVLDASYSMTEGYKGVVKFATAKAVIANFNQTMPDLPVRTALRSFGHSPSLSSQNTFLTYGPSEYSRSELAEALGKITPAGGTSPMAKGLSAIAQDLSGTQGRIALVVISDGKQIDGGPLAAVEALKAEYGDRLCIYTVLVGDDAAGRELLSALSQATGCGAAVNAGALGFRAEMADFVETVLLEPKQAPAAPTPVPEPAPKVEMPTKSDRGTWVYKDVKFEFDKATLMDATYPVLDGIAAALRDNPNISVEIQGHTDSVGREEYNLGLSQRRAEDCNGLSPTQWDRCRADDCQGVRRKPAHRYQRYGRRGAPTTAAWNLNPPTDAVCEMRRKSSGAGRFMHRIGGSLRPEINIWAFVRIVFPIRS